jgi:serine/threonine protein kinase
MAFPRPYGRYILEDRLAMGGMAEIFRARTATAGFEKKVCIKRVLPHFLEDEEFVTMFRDEAKTAARLQHANVVQVFDFGEIDEDVGTTLYLAMELVEGCDLRKLAEQSRKKQLPFSIGEVTQIGIDVCRGLHHAHMLKDEAGQPLGIVHRDISPHNILVSRQGEVKVTDFGIARAAERATHTSTGVVKGKVAYMSPEQAEGGAFDHRLDQWAVGVVLWELLCGERLFRGENDMVILKKVLAGDVPTPSSLRADVPADLEGIILRALQVHPDDRFPTLRDMELALSRFLFSGAVDPATADVGAAFTRIMEGAPAGSPRRTAVIEAAPVSLATAPPSTGGSRPRPAAPAPTPPTMVTEDIAALGGIDSRVDSRIGASSVVGSPLNSITSGDVSQVFVSSEARAAAPGPDAPSELRSSSSPAAPTVLEVGQEDLQAAVAAFEQQRSSSSSRNLPAREASRRQAPAPVETAIADGALVEAARAAGATDDDGTPATRTLVPASARDSGPITPAPPRPVTRVSSSSSSSRRTMAAAAAIVVAGALGGIGIAVSGDPPAPPTTASSMTTTTAPPATPPPATPTPAVAAPAAPPPPVAAPAPTALEPPTAPAATTSPTPASAPPPAPTPAPAPAPTPAPTTAKATIAAAPTDAKAPAKPGTVYIDVVGGWGLVSIGKKSYGETPVTLTLPAGRYVVTLTSGDGAKKKNVPVTVTSGGKAQVREQF